MRNSVVKEKLSNGETVLCVKSGYHDPEIIELIGLKGFDCIWIDIEHRSIDPATLDTLIRTCRLTDIDSVIRLRPYNYTSVLQLLEAGANGIMLPHVKGPAEVKEILSNMKFYPEGRRGFDGIHPDSNCGILPPKVYMNLANLNNFLIIQIEEESVVEHIDEIASLDGVDVLFVGPGDLTNNMGISGQFDHPKIISILEEVYRACQKHGKAAGIPCPVEKIPYYQEMGFSFFCPTSDFQCLRNGLDRIKTKCDELGFSFRELKSASAQTLRPFEKIN